MWIGEYICESRIAIYYCCILNSQFLNVFKSICWTHENQLNFARNKQPYWKLDDLQNMGVQRIFNNRKESPIY